MSALARRVWAMVFVASAALALAGCIPLPEPARGYSSASRANLPDRQPEFIAPGKTTRRDVLLQLGSPDSEASDLSWFGYSSLRDAGGYLLVDPTLSFSGGAIDIVERQLVIRFDANAVATQARFKEVRCQRGRVDFNRWDTGACLPLGDGESVSSDGEMQHDADTSLATFENIRFTVPNARTTDPGQPPLSRLFRGALSLTQHAFIFEAKSSVSLDNPPLPRLHIPYATMTELRQARAPDGRVNAVEMYSRSGIVYKVLVRFGSFDAMFGPVPSDEAIERFIAELQSLSGLTLQGP